MWEMSSSRFVHGLQWTGTSIPSFIEGTYLFGLDSDASTAHGELTIWGAVPDVFILLNRMTENVYIGDTIMEVDHPSLMYFQVLEHRTSLVMSTIFIVEDFCPKELSAMSLPVLHACVSIKLIEAKGWGFPFEVNGGGDGWVHNEGKNGIPRILGIEGFVLKGFPGFNPVEKMWEMSSSRFVHGLQWTGTSIPRCLSFIEGTYLFGLDGDASTAHGELTIWGAVPDVFILLNRRTKNVGIGDTIMEVLGQCKGYVTQVSGSLSMNSTHSIEGFVPKGFPGFNPHVEALSGHIYGNLPDLPCFKSHPLYISLSSPSSSTTSNTITTRSTANTSTSTTPGFNSTVFTTATGETMYLSAESGNSNNESENSSSRRQSGIEGFVPKGFPGFNPHVEALSGHIYGKLTDLPCFKSHPLYISLSSPSSSTTSNTITTRSTANTSTSTTPGFNSTVFTTATGETMYLSTESGNSNNESGNSSSRRQSSNFLMVETAREITFKEIIAATNNFSDSRRVAEIDFGTAYHGFLDNNQHVLVKRLGMKTCPALRVRDNVSILRWRHRYNIVKSLASAIRYLHEEWDERVIHRCITSSAIILDPDMNPRLGVFALAEFLTRNEHSHHVVVDQNKSVRGIFCYMSPEHMDSGDATTMADVYSFGVVLLEELVRLVKLGMACTRSDPESRPTMRQIVNILDGHDQWLMENGRKKEKPEEWRTTNASALSLKKWTGSGNVSFRQFLFAYLDWVGIDKDDETHTAHEFNSRELVRLVKLGMACTRSDPESRTTMRQIVNILDGHDQWLMENGRKKEKPEEWRTTNASALSLVRRIQALGIQ
ncbi:hypothetical protein T459_34725 [Capsicum annuum]|uniref:Protein kinase domain-containing protein n=1 Tax=Capsicum annuum TaxID=4072 RepID=A0A2G2XVG1_CAPAN|nr:hypothetical protein T459_34725 [Capsicum annuum]